MKKIFIFIFITYSFISIGQVGMVYGKLVLKPTKEFLTSITYCAANDKEINYFNSIVLKDLNIFNFYGFIPDDGIWLWATGIPYDDKTEAIVKFSDGSVMITWKDVSGQVSMVDGLLKELRGLYNDGSAANRLKFEIETEIGTYNIMVSFYKGSEYVSCKRKSDNLITPPANSDVIQMTKTEGNVYEIPVTINDVLKISFIFDSGASDVTVTPDVASTLIKTGTVNASDFIGTQKYVFADGSTATSKVFIIRKLTIGNHTVSNVRASISKSINAPMLLGQSVQQKFGNIVIDNNTHTIIFEN